MTKAETKLRRLSKKILNADGKPLSGKDLGEMLLAHLALMIQENNKKSAPVGNSVILKEKIIELSGSLPDNQKKIFNTYAALHNAVVRGLKEETLITSQFFHAFYKLQGYQKDVINFEERCKAAADRPMIITRTAYNALIEKALSARADRDISYYSLFFYTTEFFLVREGQPLLLPGEVRTALETLKNAKLPPPGKSDKAAARAALKAFKEDFPVLYKAVHGYMCQNIPGLSEVKTVQQTKTLFKASELTGYEPVKVMLLDAEPDTKELMSLFDENDPVQFILKSQIAGGGVSFADFTEKGFTDGIYTADIEAIDPYDIDRFSDPKIDYYGDVQFQKRCMFAAVCKCFLYNAYLKVALEGLKIDCMDAAFIDTERIEYALEQYNNCCCKAYENMTGTPKERAKRRNIVKNAFSPISAKKIRDFAARTDRLKGAFEMMNKKGHITEYFEKTRELIDELIKALEKGAFG